MEKQNTIRDAVDAFRIFLEDKTGRLHSQLAYPYKLIYYFLNIYRNAATIDYTKKRGIKDLNIPITLPCVELEEIDVVECPCAPAKGCTFYKSKHPLPEMVGGKPLAVTSLDGYVSYSFLNWFDFKSRLDSRLEPERTQPYYTFKLINGKKHFYAYSSFKVESPKSLSMVLVPYDFLELADFPMCGEEIAPTCSPLDEVFYIRKELEPIVHDMVLKALLNMKSITPGIDIQNNDNNDAQATAGVPRRRK